MPIYQKYIKRYYSETSSTTLRWALLYLILNPQVKNFIIIIIIFTIIMMTMMVKVQQRCQSEVDKLSSSIPGIEDMSSLPYCQVIFVFTVVLHPSEIVFST